MILFSLAQSRRNISFKVIEPSDFLKDMTKSLNSSYSLLIGTLVTIKSSLLMPSPNLKVSLLVVFGIQSYLFSIVSFPSPLL